MSLISTEQDNCNIKRWDIINYIASLIVNPSYLEIGTSLGENYYKINIKNKECCDPTKTHTHINYTYNMTSDNAFAIIKNKNKKYDIIFIDGLHSANQVYIDIINSLSCLNENGYILVHDCNPPTYLHARYPHEKYPNYFNSPWNGNVYQGFLKFKYENPNMYIKVIDTDWGIGIIKPNFQELNKEESLMEQLIETEKDEIVDGVIKINNKYINWDYFEKNRTKLLNLINVNDFFTFF